MKSCINCKYCCEIVNSKYGCLLYRRDKISDLFILGRIRCEAYEEILLILKNEK